MPTCPKCGKDFERKGWFDRHTRDCVRNERQAFATGERLTVRQAAYTRDAVYLIQPGSEVMFEYYEPDCDHAWARCQARISDRMHYVTLPSAALWRPAR